MSVDMYLSSSKKQADSVNAISEKYQSAFQQTQVALQSIVQDKVLSADAYTNAKSFYEAILIPLVKGGLLLAEVVDKSCTKFPEEYTMQVDSGSLKQSDLEEAIKKLNQQIQDIRAIQHDLLGSDAPAIIRMAQVAKNIVVLGVYQEAKQKLEEKLEKLLVFNVSSPAIFSDVSQLEQAINQGISEASQSWSAETQSFVLPTAESMEWATQINKAWIQNLSTSKEPVVIIDGKEYFLGAPRKPHVESDNDYPYDPDMKATWSDHINSRKWKALLGGAGLLGKMPNATAIYNHYWNGNGEPYVVDFEKAYRQDSVIQMNVDAEIARMQNAAEEHYRMTGETNFSLSSSASVIQGYPKTENWQKTLGGFHIWSSADITVTDGKVEIDIKVNAIDRYNFNKGQQDIATGASDDENGRFEALGWAHSFDVSGELERKVSWDVGSIQNGEITGGSSGRRGEGEER